MDHLTLFFTVAVGMIVQCLFFYLVIRYAVSAERRQRYEWAQMQLLAYIAKEKGVPDEEIQKVLDYTK
ncbi:MAG TPA: hypothetical protein VM012_01385 [Flavitalea sp.]|nr:hypothetical protein [Flavitalea sp.]